MFTSEYLNQINMERLIKDYSKDSFYVSYHFGLLKEFVRYKKNYTESQERRKDYINVIDLGLELNIYATEDAIRFFIFLLKQEIYNLTHYEQFEILAMLMSLEIRHNALISEEENILGKKHPQIILKKDYLKQMIEIKNIINNLIS